ncbi:GNAT family N-acetyltransferase [Cellulomonas chitinilytica]|nr:GNAT family N-acetyltransferase [Cellulomonas chitinilytica]
MTTVRRATPADLDAATALFGQYLRFYRREHAPAAVRAFLAARMDATDGVLLVAEVDETPVGLAHCYPTWSSLSLARAWVLNDLFVDPSARGTGAGRALVRAAKAEAAAAGAVYVALETERTNVVGQTLYASEGFVRDDENLHYAAPVGDDVETASPAPFSG